MYPGYGPSHQVINRLEEELAWSAQISIGRQLWFVVGAMWQNFTTMPVHCRHQLAEKPFRGSLRHRMWATALSAPCCINFPMILPRVQGKIRSAGWFPAESVGKEFEEFLKCGRLEHGFLRVLTILRRGMDQVAGFSLHAGVVAKPDNVNSSNAYAATLADRQSQKSSCRSPPMATSDHN